MYFSNQRHKLQIAYYKGDSKVVIHVNMVSGQHFLTLGVKLAPVC